MGENDEKRRLKETLDYIVKDPSIYRAEKENIIINAGALTCAIAAVQPLPGWDIFFLTPIQVIMVTYLCKVKGNPYEEADVMEILKNLIAVIGWGFLSQQGIIALYKTIIPFAGAVTTIPLVYAWTFALGKAASFVIDAKENDNVVSKEMIKKLAKEEQERASKEKNGFSLKDAKAEWERVCNQANEYGDYIKRTTAGDLETIILSSESFSNDEKNAINNLFQKRKKYIGERYKEKYNNIIIEEHTLALMTIIGSEILNRKIEPLLADVNFEMTGIKGLTQISKSEFEICRDFGRVHIFVDNNYNRHITDIKFAEDINDEAIRDTRKVFESDVIQLINEGFNKIGSQINVIHNTVTETQELILLGFEGLEKKFLEQRTDNPSGAMDCLEQRSKLIKDICTQYPTVQINYNTIVPLSLMKMDYFSETKLRVFLKNVSDGQYREKFLSKEQRGNTFVYTAECEFGEYTAYKKDGKVYIVSIDIEPKYLITEAVDFLESRPQNNTKTFYNKEIFKEFRRLVKEAKENIYIISPWIGSYAVGIYKDGNHVRKTNNPEKIGGQYIDLLKEKEGVEIFIKYGIYNEKDESGTLSEGDRLENSRKIIRHIGDELKGKGIHFSADETNTHIKAMVVDDKVCFIGSCNLLSFYSTYNKGALDTRSEYMIETEDRNIINDIKEFCMNSTISHDETV